MQGRLGLSKALKNQFAIVGLGLLAGRYPQYGQRALQAEAARLAIESGVANEVGNFGACA